MKRAIKMLSDLI